MTARLLPTALAVLVFLAAACESEEGDDDLGTRAAGLPTCEACHVPEALAADVSTLPGRDWAQVAGRGAVQSTTFIYGASQPYSVVWPRRGRHDDVAPARCTTSCHPVSSQGLRHGLSVYPPGAHELAFAPATDCAARCHLWLPTTARSEGFAPAAGEAPAYDGSFRPADLLAAVETGHTRIFDQGYEGDFTARYVARLKPGCAGCHNVQSERHGALVGCMGCHRMRGSGEELHWMHVDRINERRADVDPGHADDTACSYCHGFSSERSELTAGACYNCHLSGHQPVGEDGQPQLWPGG